VVLALLEHSADINLENETWGPPVVAAAFSGQREVVLLLLKRGADPSNASKWWQSLQDPGTLKEMPAYLKVWENAENGVNYATINALIEEMFTVDGHVTFNSIIWEWELPAVIESSKDMGGIEESQWQGAKDHVVLVSNYSSTSSSKELVERIQATTFGEYIRERWNEWLDFVLGLLDLVTIANLNSASFGMSFIKLLLAYTSAIMRFNY